MGAVESEAILPPLLRRLRRAQSLRLGLPEPGAGGNGRGVDAAEQRERDTQRDEQPGHAEAGADREPAAAGRDGHAYRRGDERPGEPAGALRREVECEADAEEAVERADHLEIARADVEHGRVVAEQ